jgi:hypothetical protein
VLSIFAGTITAFSFVSNKPPFPSTVSTSVTLVSFSGSLSSCQAP